MDRLTYPTPPLPIDTQKALDEMNRKYRDFVHAERGAPLNPDNVPRVLQSYIPLAEIWGVIDDIDRENLVARAPKAARDDLAELLTEIDDELDEWLAGPEAESETPSQEYIAFSAMRMAADIV